MTFIQAVLAAGLKPNCLKVLLALHTFADSRRQCWPSADTLAGTAKISRTQVYEALKILEKDGLISRKARGTSSSSLYTIKLAYDDPAPVLQKVTAAEVAIKPSEQFTYDDSQEFIVHTDEADGTTYVDMDEFAEKLQERVKVLSPNHPLATRSASIVSYFCEEVIQEQISDRLQAYERYGQLSDRSEAFKKLVDYFAERYAGTKFRDLDLLGYDILARTCGSISRFDSNGVRTKMSMQWPTDFKEQIELAKAYKKACKSHNLPDSEILVTPYTLRQAYALMLSEEGKERYLPKPSFMLSEQIAQAAATTCALIKFRGQVTPMNPSGVYLSNCQHNSAWDLLCNPYSETLQTKVATA